MLENTSQRHEGCSSGSRISSWGGGRAHSNLQQTASGGSRAENSVQAPAITFTKEVGASRDIDKMFQVHPVTAWLTIAIANSLGLMDSVRQLSLSYEPDAGKGSFDIRPLPPAHGRLVTFMECRSNVDNIQTDTLSPLLGTIPWRN